MNTTPKMTAEIVTERDAATAAITMMKIGIEIVVTMILMKVMSAETGAGTEIGTGIVIDQG